MKTGISINGREIDAPDHPTGNEPEYSRADLHVLDSVLCGGADRAAKRPALIDLISTAEKLRRKADDARRPEIRWWTTLGVPGSTDACRHCPRDHGIS